MLSVFAGCGGIEGDGKLSRVEPLEARRHYNIARATFHEDNTFTAIAEEDGQNLTTRGSYNYNRWKGELTLRYGAKELTYDAGALMPKELRLKTKLADGRTMTAVLLKQEGCQRCRDCPMCSKAIEEGK